MNTQEVPTTPMQQCGLITLGVMSSVMFHGIVITSVWIYYLLCKHTSMKTLAIVATIFDCVQAISTPEASYKAVTTDPHVLFLYKSLYLYLCDIDKQFTLIIAVLSWLYVYGVYKDNDYMHNAITLACFVYGIFMTIPFAVSFVSSMWFLVMVTSRTFTITADLTARINPIHT